MEMQSVKLCGPFTCIVAGSSGQGKSTLVAKIITESQHTIEDPVESVVWLYKDEADQKQLFNFIKNNCTSPVKFVKGFPEDLLENKKLFPIDGKQRVLVVDDLMQTVSKNEKFSQIFTFWSHHHNVNVFYLVQNLYPPQGKYNAMIVRNSSYIILLPSIKNTGSVRTLAQQTLPSRYQTVVKIYDEMCRESGRKRDFLLLDYTVNCLWNFRIRTGLLKDDKIHVILDDADEDAKRT